MNNLLEYLLQRIEALLQVLQVGGWLPIVLLVAFVLLVIVARRFIIFLNAIIIGAAFMGAVGAVLGGIAAFFGGTVSIAATDKFVSRDIGVFFGGLEGLVISTIATALAILVIAAALMVISGIFSAAGSGIGTPVYDVGGNITGWVGAPGPSIALGGCAIPLIAALLVAPVVGTIVGVKLNQGEVVDSDLIINIAIIICFSIGGISGLIGGGIGGASIGKTTTGGCLVGLVYGLLFGWMIRGGWVELLTGAIIGAILGSILAARREGKRSESKYD